MTTELDDKSRVVPGPAVLTDEQLAANEWASESVRSRLQALRTAAQHWQSTLSTITALFGAATVLDADKAVRTLAYGWNYFYGAAVVLSLMCAGLSLKWASQAGVPQNVTIPIDINKRTALHKNVLERTESRLAWSRSSAAPAVALLILAICIRWYAPQIPPAKPDPAAQHSQELTR